MVSSASRILGLALLAIATAPASAAQQIVPSIPSEADAPIALLIDVSSGQTLFARDPDRRFMPASVTKVMSTYVAFQRMSEGKLFPKQVTAMGRQAFKDWRGVGSTMYLNENVPVTIDDLVHGVTTVSANDGAVVLAEAALGSVAAWTAAMNEAARKLGMRDSHFNTPNGWMDDGRTFTTAHDLVILGAAMVTRYPSYYRHFVGAHSFTYNGIHQRNHDPISGVVPGADGIKTGFTNQAGYGFLGSAQRNGRRLMMVVAASPTGRARNAAAMALLEWGFQSFDSRLMFPMNTVIGEAKVQNGGLRSVNLVPLSPIRVSMPHGAKPEITLKIAYDGPIKAPIKQGQPVASLLIHLDGKQVSSLPLAAATSVATASPVQRMINGVATLLPW